METSFHIFQFESNSDHSGSQNGVISFHSTVFPDDGHLPLCFNQLEKSLIFGRNGTIDYFNRRIYSIIQIRRCSRKFICFLSNDQWIGCAVCYFDLHLEKRNYFQDDAKFWNVHRKKWVWNFSFHNLRLIRCDNFLLLLLRRVANTDRKDRIWRNGEKNWMADTIISNDFNQNNISSM